MRKILVITVGTGRGVDNAITYSVTNRKYDLVVFLATQKSWKTTGTKILERLPNLTKIEDLNSLSDQTASDTLPYMLEIVTEYEDVENLSKEYLRTLLKLRNKFSSDEITIDYTPGTKPMSASLFLAGIETGIGELEYITGQRDKDGRVISGSEKIILSKTTYLQFRISLHKAIDLFNHGIIRSAHQILTEINYDERHPLYTPSLFLKNLVEGYYKWDLFQFQKAYDILSSVSRDYSDLLPKFGVKRRVKESTMVLKNLKANEYHQFLVLDLLANAERRYHMGRYDDAVARLYRLTEYIGQFILVKEYEQDPSNINISEIRDPKIKAELQQKGTPTVGLHEAYEILARNYNHPIGTQVYNDITNKNGKLKKLLSVRNQSLLAHGIKPIDEETVNEFISYFKENILESFIPGWEDKYRWFKFPRIRIQTIYEF